MEENQLYLPTTLDTKVNLPASQINPHLDINIKRAVERKFGNKFFSFGHVRPGTIKVLKRSIGNKIGNSDFTGSFSFSVVFQCEVFLPQVGQEIDARVKSICKIGILGKSDNNKITVMLSKPHQSNLELFSQVMQESRIRAKILDFRIDNQNSTINVIADLISIVEGVYQNYLLPRVDDVMANIAVNFQTTSEVNNLYFNFENYNQSINSKSLMDPYSMFMPSDMDPKKWNQMKNKKDFFLFKDYWRTAKSMVEEYELVYPTGGYNGNKGVAVIPFNHQPISRAYFKMWELLYRYRGIIDQVDSDKNLRFLNLGEAPGGFVQALAHFRMKEYNMSGDSFYAYSLKVENNSSLLWDFPKTQKAFEKLSQNIDLNYGDLTVRSTIEGILKKMKGNKVDVVTADGAFTTSKVYNYEEIVNYKIFYGEIVSALVTQKVGGSFVLKIFDILTFATRQLLLLLNHYYSEVYVTKPDFSRPASSEKYVICLGFKGLEVPEQTEEQAIDILLDLMDLWNEKVDEKFDIFYPENDAFVLNLLSYTLSEDDDFARKFIDINYDHINKQTKHINHGIHLIHTKTIFNEHEVRRLKKEQISKAVNWCQRYQLNYDEDVALSNEKMGNEGQQQIINTRETLDFNVMTVNEDSKDVFDYLMNEYVFLSLDYLRDRFLGMQERLEDVVDNFRQNEIYQYKTSLLNPTDLLNNAMKKNETYSFYSIWELMSKYVKFTDSTDKKIEVFVNLDHINTQMSRCMVEFINKTSKRDLDWVGSMVYSDNLPDPSNWLAQYQEHWLMSEDLNGDVRDISNLNKFQDAFDKKKVDLYMSDLRIPLENANMLIVNPERFFMKDIMGQTFVMLSCLKNGGHAIMRMYTCFEKLSVSMLTLLTKMFETVLMVKPLASLPESMECYLVCQKFKMKEWTEETQTEYLVMMNDLTDDRSELMDQEYVLPELDVEKMGMTNDEMVHVTQNLLYISYNLVVLNHFPKSQINLDLINNPRYQLGSEKEPALLQTIGDKQQILTKSKFTDEDQNDLRKLNGQIKELFREVSNKIMNEDFQYILRETSENWLKLYQK